MHNVGRLSHRMLTLMELQAELLKVDARDAQRALARPLVFLFGGAVFGLCSVPLLMIAVAHALREWAAFSWTTAFFAAAVLASAIAAGAILTGWLLLRKRLGVFNRSVREFRTNMTWLKESLKGEEIGERGRQHIH